MNTSFIFPQLYINQKNLVRFLAALVCLALVFYIYCALATAYYVVGWDDVKHKIEERMISVSELEYEYSFLQGTITEEGAYALGFEEAKGATYTLRKRLVSN